MFDWLDSEHLCKYLETHKPRFLSHCTIDPLLKDIETTNREKNTKRKTKDILDALQIALIIFNVWNTKSMCSREKIFFIQTSNLFQTS